MTPPSTVQKLKNDIESHVNSNYYTVSLLILTFDTQRTVHAQYSVLAGHNREVSLCIVLLELILALASDTESR